MTSFLFILNMLYVTGKYMLNDMKKMTSRDPYKNSCRIPVFNDNGFRKILINT